MSRESPGATDGKVATVLRTVAEGVARSRGEAFFSSMVLSLTEALAVDFAMVGELLPGEPERIRTVAFARDGALAENTEYRLAGTPCEGVVGKETCVYTRGIRDLFPEDDDIRTLGAEGYLGTPLLDSAGGVLGVMLIMSRSPIAEPELARSALEIFADRAGAELERHRREALLDVAQARTGVGTFVWDMESGGIYWSSEMYRLFGWERDDGPPTVDEFLELVHPEDRSVVLEAHEALVGRPDPVVSEIRTDPERGPVRHLNAVLRWDPGFEGRKGRVSGNIMDMTERRALERQLAQALKMEAVGRLAGGVAHDFNNLLTVIMGEAEDARAGVDDEVPVAKALESILEAAARGAGLTRQLLQFSRVDRMKRTTFDLNVVIRDSARILDRVLEENVRLELRLDPEPLLVRGDEGRLEQVLVNLAVNARDAMPDGGRVTIWTGTITVDADEAVAREVEPGRFAALRVADTGSGIALEIKDRLFEPFFTTKGPAAGSGLGLSTSYGIVKQHGGFIEVESAPGEGTTFSVALPLRRPDSPD